VFSQRDTTNSLEKTVVASSLHQSREQMTADGWLHLRLHRKQ